METTTLSNAASLRLTNAMEDFGGPFVVSEPFPGRPPLWLELKAQQAKGEPCLHSVDACRQWMASHNQAIEAALLEFGAIVWRGLPVTGTGEFEQLFSWLPAFAKGYAGGTSDRKTIAGNVMEATRTPPEVNIFLHQEMSYLPGYPRLLAFYCKQAASRGGETPICDMRGLLEDLPEDIRHKLQTHGVHYIRNLRSELTEDWRADPVWRHASWQYWFDTDSQQEVSAKLAERGAECRWNDDGSLTYWTAMPATTVHPATRETLYFNQLYAQQQRAESVGVARAEALDAAYGEDIPRPYMVSYGNGEPLSNKEFAAIDAIFATRKVTFDWQAGDVMLVENRLTAHGRHQFEGERDVQVLLFE